MASNSANTLSQWFPEAQRARMEQSIRRIVGDELSMNRDFRGPSTDDPRGQIEVFDKLLSVLSTCRNRLVPINCLPQDIMGQIFSIILKLESIEDLEWPVDRDDDVSIVEQRERLRLVSRSWNSFILSTPGFWSTLDIRAPNSVLSKGVERAQQRELCLVLEPRSFKLDHPERLTRLLSPHYPRIRTLRLSDQEITRAFLKIPLPTLCTLEIRLRNVNMPWPIISQDQYHRLNALALTDCPLISSRTPLNTLRILHLDQAPDGLDEILGFLQGCPNLEELNILPLADLPWTINQTFPAVQLHNLRLLEMHSFHASSLPCFFQKARIPNIKQIAIWIWRIRPWSVSQTLPVARTLQESLDTLQLSGSGSRIVELFISSSAVSCVAADGLSVSVKLAHEPGCRELARYFLDRLDPKMLCVTINLQGQGEISWVEQMLSRRNVVELRLQGGTLNSTRILVDYLALFNKETVAEEAEDRPDLELSTNVTLPWHSLQTLVFEAVEVDLPQLLRMATTRVNNRQDAPSRLQWVTLINCGTGNSPDLSSKFHAVGVDLQLQ